MASFGYPHFWNSQTLYWICFWISCLQTAACANIGCQFQFLKAKSLMIAPKEPGHENQKSILAALQVENENSCAKFCCEFDLLDKSKEKCGAAVFSKEKSGNLDSDEKGTIHNCFLFNCDIPEHQNCKVFHNATDVVTTILVDPRNDLTPVNPNIEAPANSRGASQNSGPTAGFPLPPRYSQNETTSSTNALLVTLVILISCIALVAGVVMSNYLYQQYQKRKLYYKLDKMDGNGDFFSSEDKYNYNE